MDLLDPNEILKRLGGSLFSRNIVFRNCLDSTNTLAKELALERAPEGTLVLTEEQTGGRGRLGRTWFSPGYLNLLFSILLRPRICPHQIFVLTMIMALAATEAVRELSGLRVKIKWPNDLYVERRKLAGILTEFSQKDKALEYVVIGLGLNVNWDPEGTEAFAYPPTSVYKETGRMISRDDLLCRILILFEAYYQEVLKGHIDGFYEEWNALSLILGKEVEVMSAEKRITGTAVRIDDRGVLVIRDRSGEERRILSGDVTLKF